MVSKNKLFLDFLKKEMKKHFNIDCGFIEKIRINEYSVSIWIKYENKDIFMKINPNHINKKYLLDRIRDIFIEYCNYNSDFNGLYFFDFLNINYI